MDSPPVPVSNAAAAVVAADSLAPRYLGGESQQQRSHQQQLPKLAISLDDIAAGLDGLADDSPPFDQFELTAQFSPILGEGDHLFSPEELAQVLARDR